MTPAEREALKQLAEKVMPERPWRSPWLPGSKQLCAGVEVTGSHYIYLNVDRTKDHHPSTVERWKDEAAYITAAQPEAILHLLDLISSLELTLSNATAAGVKQLERIAALEESGKWISVQQEPPPEGEPLLIVWKGVVQHLTYMLYEGEWYPYHADPDDRWGIEDGLTTVTHWRELPAPPTEPTPALEAENAQLRGEK